MTINPTLAAAIAATGVPLSADHAPQPATPRWRQARIELIRTFRDYMPETAATKATDALDELLAELGLPAATAEWGVRLVDGGYTATSRDWEQALENLAGLNAHDQAAVLVTRTVHRSEWTEVK
ncbi:hypothetical protein ABT150_23045 [Streptomyces mirabilis]|uniref:hypothetical protein n=1 Tax=Streptomyces mirabilis TaxID=68239 RepID=UPI00332B358D